MNKFYPITLLVLFFIPGGGFVDATAQERDRRMVMEESVPELKITLAGNRLIVENLARDAVLDVFSIVGVKVYSQKIKAGTNEYTLHLPKGYYIIRIGNFTKKIALK